jgi:outer membrane protein assembly factor BamB
MKKESLAVILCCFVLAVLVGGADWPQWRGPDRTDVSKETGLLQKWPAQGPPLAWTYDQTGLGYSGPAIVGNRLYIMGTRERTEFVFALDAETGKPIWATQVGPIMTWKGNSWGDGPRSTPTVDGDRLYALGSQGELVCLDVADGRKVWSQNLFDTFHGHVMDNSGKEKVGWGYCEGVLVDGDKVVCSPGGDEGLLLALDKKTGQTIWRSKEVKSKAPYSSIIAAEVGGIRQYIQTAEKGAVGVAANDGRLLWQAPRNNDDLIIRTPIFHNNYLLLPEGLAGTSIGAGSYVVQLNVDGQQIKAEKLFANKRMKNEMGGMVLVGEHVYGYADGSGWVCAEFQKKKGDFLWEEKRKLGKGSVTFADGQLYCFCEDDGTAALIEAKPTKFTENGRFKIPRETKNRTPSGKIWSHPVVANGRLYLRDQELLFCYDVRAGSK